MRIERERLNPSILDAAKRLETEFPGVPLVALGQTVFWDEPVKAALCAVLGAIQPESRSFLFGVNDHDYFSKTAAPLNTDQPFAILEHNDGSTRDLWVATGELSVLFGSEAVPTRELLRRGGAELEKAAREGDETHAAFADRMTAAWGWRGIVQTGDWRQIAHEIRLAAILPCLRELLRWGLAESTALLATEEARAAAAAFTNNMLEWLEQYNQAHPDALLSDAYQDAHRRFFHSLTECDPAQGETFTSTDHFRFCPETASLPRFRVLELFLNPATRDAAYTAYNTALAGAQTYTLDRFGEGAIPFDLVIPGRGRGTIRVLPDGVAIATPTPIWLPASQRVESAAQLAALTAQWLGENVTLVGKALVFVCMVNAEAMLVFHEGGSAYVHRTAQMLEQLDQQGIALPLYPILRIRHHTWDALAQTSVRFCLPPHLAEAFGTAELDGSEFARRWRQVVAEQEELLRTLAAQGSARELLDYLAGAYDDEWPQRRQEYERAHALLLSVRARSEQFEARSRELYEKIARLKDEAADLEAAKGKNYREKIKPRRERLWELSQQGISEGPEVEALQKEIEAQESPRAVIEREIRERRELARALEQEAKKIRKERLANEKEGEAAVARKSIASIEQQAELARLLLARRAILVSRGLPQCNNRPSAWWFLLADPQGRWFENLAHAMEIYFEPLSPRTPERGQA